MPSGFRKDGTKIIPPSSKGKKWPNRKPVSEEVRKKMSDTQKRIHNIPPNWKGKKRSEHWMIQQRLAKKGVPSPRMHGETNPMWKGGTSLLKMYPHQLKVAGRAKPKSCEICGAFGSDTKKGIVFDHDHNTGKFRGWICGRCNTALGMVKDNVETLQALINYLLKSRE